MYEVFRMLTKKKNLKIYNKNNSDEEIFFRARANGILNKENLIFKNYIRFMSNTRFILI